jgi:serine/threonine-protein kinase RsbW
MKEEIIITNHVDELPVLAEKIEALAESWELSMPLAMNINLALEEAISNVIFYAFDDEKEHDIKIVLSLENKTLTIEIIDDGKPFDPTARQQPDVSLPAEDRPIGGLGIFLIRKMMDNVTYTRHNNLNTLTLLKNI